MIDLAMIVVLLLCPVWGAWRGARHQLLGLGVRSAGFSMAGTLGPPEGGGTS